MAGFNPLAALYAGMKVKKGPAPISPHTPPFSGGMYKPPVDPGNQIALGSDDGYTPEQADLRATIAHPPQEGVKPDGKKIGGFRRVLGEIASNVGPLIGGPAVAGLGEKLLHPGLDKWNSDVARKQALAQMSVDARNHQDLEANRKLQQQQRLDNQSDKEQAGIDRVEGKGGWQAAMPTPQASLSTRLYQPNQPQQPTPPQGPPTMQDLANLPTNQTSVQQTMPNVEDQVDPRTGKRVGDVGDVEWLNTPGTQGKQNRPYVRPSQQTLQDMEVRKRAADLEAAKTETLSDDEAQQLNDLGFKGNFKGQKMTSADARARREDIKARLNSRDTIAAKPEPASKENENQWIADAQSDDPDVAAAAKVKLKRLHDERMATRAAPDPSIALDRLDKISTKYSAPHRKALADADAQLEKIAEAKAFVNGSASAQAVAIPKILTAVVSGPGSGVRITSAELNALGHARGIEGDVEGFLNSVSGNGTLTATQQRQYTQLLDDVKTRILQKRAIADEALDNIAGSATRDEILGHDKTARKKMAEFVTGGESVTVKQTNAPKVGQVLSGSKIKTVKEIK